MKHIIYSLFPGLIKKKTKEKLQSLWGNEIPKKRKKQDISLYHELIKNNSKSAFVDKTTWEDLNFDSFFKKIDRTISTIGAQFLFHKMHKYSTKNLDYKISEYKYFLENKEVREKIQLQLFKLKNKEAYSLPNLIFKDDIVLPKFANFVFVLSLLAMFSTVLTIINPTFFLFLIGMIITNIATSYFYISKLRINELSISYLDKMLLIAKNIGSIKDRKISNLKKLEKHEDFIRKLRKKTSWLAIDISMLDQIAQLIITYLNFFYLFNVVSFVYSINSIKKKKNELADIYQLIGELDSSIGIASFLENKKYCKPEFNNESKILVKQIYHPLLEKPVANDFNLQDKSVLITGSNMAGKTTFIKTIGINLILARTLGFCLAEKANFPKLVVKTSIKRADNINQDKSYYYKEIEAILKFLEQEDGKHLFLIDEIFRGTNTAERIASSTSVLNYLADKNLSFVTTHDIELQSLLKEKFVMHHFCESVENENHFFDYKIKNGPTKTRNAIKLLEIKGYPEIIIQNANKLVEKF